MEFPAHSVVVAGLSVITGNGLTVTETVTVFGQPFVLFPVTVYVVLTVGFAVVFTQLVQLKAVAGDHV